MKQIFFLFALLVSLSGCATTQQSIAPTSISDTETQTKQTTLLDIPDQTEVAPHVVRYEYPFSNQSLGNILLFRFAPDVFDWTFVNGQQAKTVSEWANEYPQAVFILNGVYFNEDNLPSGALFINGEQIGDRQFDLNRSALLSLSPTPQIIETEKRDIVFEQYPNAAQSYPLLIKNGASVIETDSQQLAIRSFAGTDTDGNIYFGIVRNEQVSLFRLAELLLDTKITWNKVLNLDGGGSSGLYSRFDMRPFEQFDDHFNSLNAVPNVIMASPKTETSPSPSL